MCTALNDTSVINAFGKIISDRVMEALGAMENRLRTCEASIKEDEEIEIVNDFKFLGIILNKHMKWTSHTESIANIISKYTGVINRLKYSLPLPNIPYTYCVLYIIY